MRDRECERSEGCESHRLVRKHISAANAARHAANSNRLDLDVGLDNSAVCANNGSRRFPCTCHLRSTATKAGIKFHNEAGGRAAGGHQDYQRSTVEIERSSLPRPRDLALAFGTAGSCGIRLIVEDPPGLADVDVQCVATVDPTPSLLADRPLLAGFCPGYADGPSIQFFWRRRIR